MTFGEKMKDFLEKGLETSRDFMTKAGAKAQDMGEKGVLKLEIAQLQSQAQKLLARLGTEVYTAISEKDAETLTASDPEIATLVAQITEIKKSIEKREKELKS